MTREDIQKILEIGISLSAEKDLNRLWEKILKNVMQLTGCDAGTLCLKEGEFLKFKVMQNHTTKCYYGGADNKDFVSPIPMNCENICARAILENRTLCVKPFENTEGDREEELAPCRGMAGYAAKSRLIVPMRNREGESVGVLQLANATDSRGKICAFSPDMIMAAESVASQAAITIQNMRYIEDIKELFRSFVKVISSAIDERTPYNAAHTDHMAECGLRFMEYLNRISCEKGEEVPFRQEHAEELMLSIRLHDIGKLVIPIEIMDKATRLQPKQMTEILHRFEIIGLNCRIAYLEGKLSGAENERLQEEVKRAGELVKRANSDALLDDELLHQLKMLGAEKYCGSDGKLYSWITEEEYQGLTIQKGTLSEEERRIMENHVVFTERFLSEIKFPSEYRHVTEWAFCHHEFLDGSGYPRGLKGEEIPYEARIITILDIFDALTADDRPYKPGMPLEEALTILKDMAECEGKLDPVLTNQFIESRCWETAGEAGRKSGRFLKQFSVSAEH